MELLISTDDYRMYLPELDTEWEAPEGDDSEEDIVPSKLDINSLVLQNASYQEQIRDTKSNVLSLSQQIADLTQAVSNIQVS